ncbi:hypothetical protein EXIGLDRAFT_626816, partial [Exidia glandulosa HHB12029]
MFYTRAVFDQKTFKILDPPHQVHFGDDSTVDATGTGDVLLYCPKRRATVRFKKALLVPSFTVNLLSIGRLDKAGHTSVFSQG